MNCRVFSVCFPYALSGYALWTLSRMRVAKVDMRTAKDLLKGGVSVCLRLSTFARVCLRFRLCICLRLSAFVCVCLRLLAFAYAPLVRPPLRDTEK